MFDPPAWPPAGWYPDPEQSPGFGSPSPMRWWDGHHWGPTAPPPAVDDRYPDVGQLLGDSFGAMWKRWRALAALSAFTAAPASILSAIAVAQLFDDLRVVDDEFQGWTNDRLWVVVPLMVVSVGLYLFGTIAGVRVMLDTIDRDSDRSSDRTHAEPITTRGELVAAWRAVVASVRVTPRLIGWCALIGLAALGAFSALVTMLVVATPLGVILLLAAIPLMFWLGIKLAFLAVAIVDRPGNPYTRSFAVSHHRYWATFGRLLLVGVIAGVISGSANAATSASTGETWSGTGQNQQWIEVTEDGTSTNVDFASAVDITWWSLTVSVLAAVLVGVFATGTMNAAMARMYRTRNPRKG